MIIKGGRIIKSIIIPEITCSLCTQAEFENAVFVILDCYTKSDSAPLGYFSPGAGGEYYGNAWWSLDYDLIVDGAKWLDFSYAKDLVTNLLQTQCENGRIKLYSTDMFYDTHTPYREEKIASLPKYFRTIFSAAMMWDERKLQENVLSIMEKSLEWWISERQDKETNLISAMFEETFIPNTVSRPKVYAPMDTNIEIMDALKAAGILAEKLGFVSESLYF